MTNLRVTFVISSLGAGGAELVLTTLANHWAGHGWDISIISLNGGDETPFFQLHPAIQSSGLGLMSDSSGFSAAVSGNLKRVWALRRTIRTNNPQVVISFMDITNILTLLATRGMRVPVVISEHTNPARHVLRPPWNTLRRWIYPWANRLTLLFSGIECFFPARMHEHIRIIPNPILPPPESGVQPPMPGRQNLVAVGRLELAKGFDLLLAAFAAVAPSYPMWGVVVLGEGPQHFELQAQVEEYGLTSRVLFTGQVNNPYDYYRAADLFVLSSRYEGFPMALCEAMSVGLPVVAARASGGVETIVRDGVDGLLVSLEDVAALASALDALMSSPDRRAEMGRQARTITTRFDLQSVSAMWENMLAELV